MTRHIKYLSLCLIGILLLTGCGQSKDATAPANNAANTSAGSNKVIELTVAAETDNWEMLEGMFASFQAQYPNKQFNITLTQVNEADTKEVILRDVHSGIDIFSFPDDQFSSLLASGILSPVADQKGVSTANVSEAVASCTYKDVVYGYPYTADNGYFLYYNKKYFKDSDLQTMDRILEVCAENEKKMSMEINSGWYMYSFYGQTGMSFGINDDGITNHCDWNSTTGDIKGYQVTEAMASLIANEAFAPQGDGDFVNQFIAGDCIAGISGTWNAASFIKALGNDLGATKLPTYTVAGKQVQMASFTGYKIMGVNSYSENLEWAHKLADWITNEENQTIRFVQRSQGPSNINAAVSDEVSKNVAISAVLQQAQYGVLQRVGNKYWGACSSYANALIDNNLGGMTYQELADKLVKEITASSTN